MKIRIRHDLVLVDGSALHAGQELEVNDIRAVIVAGRVSESRLFARDGRGRVIQLRPQDCEVIE